MTDQADHESSAREGVWLHDRGLVYTLKDGQNDLMLNVTAHPRDPERERVLADRVQTMLNAEAEGASRLEVLTTALREALGELDYVIEREGWVRTIEVRERVRAALSDGVPRPVDEETR